MARGHGGVAKPAMVPGYVAALARLLRWWNGFRAGGTPFASATLLDSAEIAPTDLELWLVSAWFVRV